MYKRINKLREVILNFDNGDVFKSNKEQFDEIEGICVEIVKMFGYKVISPSDKYRDIDGPIGLLNFFNSVLQYKHPEYIPSNVNIPKNRKIIRKFINSRIEASNVSEKEAIKECAEIIETIFLYEDRFNFEYVIDIGILGQANLGWVTDLAVNIINNRKKKEKEKEVDEFFKKLDEKLDNDCDKEVSKLGDLDIVLKSIKK